MLDHPLDGPRLSDTPDSQLADYGALSGLAVAGLVAGLASPAAMLDPLLWIVPPVGMVLSGLALWRIRRQAPALAGRKAALVGLVLSIVFAVAAPADWLIYRRLLRGEARQFADLWFDALRQGQPQKAHQLTLDPNLRRAGDQRVAAFYHESPRRQDDLKSYTQQPLVRSLLALGPKAQARFYQTDDQTEEGDKDWVQLTYVVSYVDRDGPKSLFVDILLQRAKLGHGRANWRVFRADQRDRPEGWSESEPN
jgi:hypothetical protein